MRVDEPDEDEASSSWTETLTESEATVCRQEPGSQFAVPRKNPGEIQALR